MTSTEQARPQLHRDGIVVAATALADQAGVGAVTMRKVAASLGYEVMSLYNHVANKDELLTLMADSVAEPVVRPGPDHDPLAAVRAIALSIRASLVERPWAAELWLGHAPGPARKRVMEDLLRSLHTSRLHPDLAHHGFHAVFNHVVGYTLQELAMARVDDMDASARQFLAELSTEEHRYTIAHVNQHLDGDTGSSFELVLDLILDGIERLSDGREKTRTGGSAGI